MKIWIDDIRPAPNGWVWAKNSADAIKLIYTAKNIEEISFDHDLGGDDTAYRVATLIEELAYKKKINKLTWHIHSANPIGVRNIRTAMENADKYWSK